MRVAFGTQTHAVPFSEYLLVDGALMRIKVDGATATLLVQSGACGLGKILARLGGTGEAEVTGRDGARRSQLVLL
jgi:hypothetical protein